MDVARHHQGIYPFIRYHPHPADQVADRPCRILAIRRTQRFGLPSEPWKIAIFLVFLFQPKIAFRRSGGVRLLRLADIDDWLTARVHINGHATYSRKFTSGFYGTIIQVVKKNHLLHGENVITFEYTVADDDLRVVAQAFAR